MSLGRIIAHSRGFGNHLAEKMLRLQQKFFGAFL
jgi:hypothetical protein